LKCVDDSVDLCPYGHVLYGCVTLAIVIAPGVAFGFSEFMHFKVRSLSG
jgi:hypothetical protein